MQLVRTPPPPFPVSFRQVQVGSPYSLDNSIHLGLLCFVRLPFGGSKFRLPTPLIGWKVFLKGGYHSLRSQLCVIFYTFILFYYSSNVIKSH